MAWQGRVGPLARYRPSVASRLAGAKAKEFRGNSGDIYEQAVVERSRDFFAGIPHINSASPGSGAPGVCSHAIGPEKIAGFSPHLAGNDNITLAMTYARKRRGFGGRPHEELTAGYRDRATDEGGLER